MGIPRKVKDFLGDLSLLHWAITGVATVIAVIFSSSLPPWVIFILSLCTIVLVLVAINLWNMFTSGTHTKPVPSIHRPDLALPGIDMATGVQFREHQEVDFSGDLDAAVALLMPSFRLPDKSDIAGEWADNFNPKTLFPVLCSGEFTGRGIAEYAFFVIGEQEVAYKVAILTETSQGHPELIELEANKGRPQRRYLRTVPLGQHTVSRAVWKRGGPKTLHLKREAIEVGTYEGAACIYYWSDEEGRFLRQWISD